MASSKLKKPPRKPAPQLRDEDPPEAQGFPIGAAALMEMYGGDAAALTNFLKIGTARMDELADAEAMDAYPLINSALDILADEATQLDGERRRVAWIESPDKATQDALDAVLRDVVRVESRGWAHLRRLFKYGDHMAEVLFGESGVEDLVDYPIHTMRRVESDRGRLRGFVQEFKGKLHWTEAEYDALVEEYERFEQEVAERAKEKTSWERSRLVRPKAIPFDPLQIVHFRLMGSESVGGYGTGVLSAVRWAWRRLLLLDDAAMIFRLDRAPERLAFYLDVGNKGDDEALAYINKYRRMYRKRRYTDSSGKPGHKYDPVSADEDIFIATNANSNSRVEALTSPAWQCLVGETRIPLLDGTTPTIAELSQREGGFWLYACDAEGKIVPGYGHSARVTHESAEVMEVELDNGEVVRCTSNHPFLTRAGQWVQAGELTPGTALMPLYRRTSMKAEGDYLQGYERVYHPGTGRWEYTHHAVYRHTQGDPAAVWAGGGIIHHGNHDKRNNDPTNLHAMSRKLHAQEHRDNAVRLHTPAVKARALQARTTPEAKAKARQSWDADSARQTRHRARMQAYMGDPTVRAAKAAALTTYNQSEAHRAAVSGVNHPRFRPYSFAELVADVQRTGAKTQSELQKQVKIAQGTIRAALREAGMTWAQFAAQYIEGWVPRGRGACMGTPAYLNHTVRAVRFTGQQERVYDLTVDQHHNFAIAQGVIVHNSVDDLDFFRTLLFAGLKVPRAYMGDDTGVVRATLSSQDVRFARGVMRGQQAYREGLAVVCDLHALRNGVDPATLDYDIAMTAPSAIFELAQIEVRTARAQLATMLGEFFPAEYILTRVFGLSEQEARAISSKKKDELQAAQEMGIPAPGMGGGGEMPPEESSAEEPAPSSTSAKEAPPSAEMRRRLDRLLTENRAMRKEVTRVGSLLKQVASLAQETRATVRSRR